MRIGILGGSFNPIHNAHIALCETARAYLNLDKIIIIPTGDNPFKSTENLVSRFDRYEMSKLCIKDMPHYEVSDIEVMREGVSYTVDTITQLKNEKYPNDELFFIIGSDIVYHLDEWKSIRRLSKMVCFICVAREGIDNTLLSDKKTILNENYGVRLILIQNAGIKGISSTMIRSLAKEHNPLLKEYVKKEVYDYIIERSLYD